jgi:putative membrane protein
MKNLLLRWIVLAFSVFAASVVTQALNIGFRTNLKDFASVLLLLVGVAVLALLNATLGRLLRLMTLPLSCITLGLFSLIVNALVLWLAASLGLGFSIASEGFQGFLAALVASILISLISGVVGVFLPDDDKDD